MLSPGQDWLLHCGLTAAAATCTRPVQNRASQYTIMGGEEAKEVLSFPEEPLTVDGYQERGRHFLQWWSLVSSSSSSK